MFPLKKVSKSWITWITSSNGNEILVFDQLQNSFLTYDEAGEFLKVKSIGDDITENLSLFDILPSTGLLIKYDPSIQIIYFGFGLLMLTACFSYLPYTQIWIFNQKRNSWLGSSTNRGKIQLEIEFENLIRWIENVLTKNVLLRKEKKKRD